MRFSLYNTATNAVLHIKCVINLFGWPLLFFKRIIHNAISFEFDPDSLEFLFDKLESLQEALDKWIEDVAPNGIVSYLSDFTSPV